MGFHDSSNQMVNDKRDMKTTAAWQNLCISSVKNGINGTMDIYIPHSQNLIERLYTQSDVETRNNDASLPS